MLTSSPPNLSQLALLFLKIGIIGFGGQACHYRFNGGRSG
jgi:chromate transporter